MTFAPYLCSTPKFVSVINQPSHFIIAAPLVDKSGKQRQLINSYCRPLKKCHRYHSKQFNASTAINRQHHFDNDTTIHNNQQHIFFCLPFNLFYRTKRRHRPCHV
jgi:hypothetical protein